MLTAVLFTIARTWKQHRCPSTDEWIKKLWYIYIQWNITVIKRNPFESVLVRCMNTESIIQSEVTQKEKKNKHILTYIYMESRKMVLINLFARKLWRCRHREWTCGLCGGRRGWKKLS